MSNSLIQALTIMSENFRVNISKELGKTYVSILESYDVNWEKVAIHFIKNSDKFPTINQIINFIDPQIKNVLTTRQQGINLLDEALSHVRKFGWNNERDAFSVMSDKLKVLIQRLGGWERICKADTTNTAFMAQARDIAEGIVLLDDYQIAIQKSILVTDKDKKSELTSAQDIIKKLDFKNE